MCVCMYVVVACGMFVAMNPAMRWNAKLRLKCSLRGLKVKVENRESFMADSKQARYTVTRYSYLLVVF